MFNVAVVNLKDLIKYLVELIFVILLLICFTRYFFIEKNGVKADKKIKLEDNFKISTNKSFKKFLNNTIPAIEEINNEGISQLNNIEKKVAEKSIAESLLKVELLKLKEEVDEGEEENKDIKEANETTQAENQKEDRNQQQLQETSADITTEVVTQNPIVSVPTDYYGKVQIRNQTSYVLNEEVLKPNIEVNNQNIIIFHTHTCESYTQTEQNSYEASGTYRTTDLNYSVARVGDELENCMKNNGYNVIHDKTYHDYPSYSGSYARSLKTVESIKQNCNADVIIDLHRDAIGSNSSYAPTVRIGEDYAAQLMFVIGTDAGGLWHPNWQQNLKFAVKVQEKAEEMYPGLFKPIIVRNSRYNQHVSKAATIIEVGATGNTLEQSITSMKYLSNILNEVIK